MPFLLEQLSRVININHLSNLLISVSFMSSSEITVYIITV